MTYSTTPVRERATRVARRPIPESPKASAKRRPSKRRVWVRRLLIGASIALFASVVAGAAVFAWVWNTIDLPNDKPPAETTFITDANGDRLATLAGENRVQVPLSTVPSIVTQAVLDTEDHNYFSHRGVDPKGITRALWSDLRGEGNLQGGSTITQQYVKKVYVGEDQTIVRKAKEAILAIKLEQKYSKNEILERYLNVIYFGRGAYGLETASKAYFGKSVNEIGLRESAYLAGLIRAPELADAYASPEVAVSRRNATLDNMEKFGSITPEQLEEVKKQPLQSYVIPRAQQESSIVGGEKGSQYFLQYVRSVLVQRYGEEKVLTGGLRVKTTLDLKTQGQAYDSIYGFLKPGEPSGALVSLDQNGAIKAMVGGRDWSQSKVNFAVGKVGGGSGRQPGSTFKPIVLAAALEEGISIRDTYPGTGRMVVKGWSPTNIPVSNYGNEPYGNIDLIEATVYSVNTIYAQLAVDVGLEKMKEMAKKMGVSATLPDANSIALGAGEVSPLDMASAYLTFSQRGVHVETTPILEVKDANGGVLERFNPKRTRVMSERNADLATYALSQVMQRGTGGRAQFGKPAAGKTGTTEDNADAWFVGYTPSMATAVWMGYPEGSTHRMSNVRGISVTGGTFPAQMWSNFMRQATSGQEATGFTSVSLPPSKMAPPTTTTTTTDVVPEGQTPAIVPDEDVITPTTVISAAPKPGDERPSRGGGGDRGRDRDVVNPPNVTILPPTTTYLTRTG